MTGLPPFELGADQVRPIIPEFVTAGLFAKFRGADSASRVETVTTFENSL